ncbi:hypothetical protein MUP79_08185 [Candidatus Bathyarchaeota archaeon]|nr:hypothetical protein [Candidatus Bathyarchaeota archaeon]
MTYGQVADVKERLNIAESDINQDDRITRALNQADALIDLELSPYTTVPLTTGISNVIVDVANDWAAGLIQQEIINPTGQSPSGYPQTITENVLIQRAKASLARYIELSFRETDSGAIYEQSVDVDG